MPLIKRDEYAINSQCYINAMMKHISDDLDKLEKEIKNSENRADNTGKYRRMLRERLEI